MDSISDTIIANVHASLPTYEAVPRTVRSQHLALGENALIDQNVPLSKLRLDGGTQSRAAMDDAVIAEYTDALCDGATLPPLVVYFDGVDFWLADGFHRFYAYRAASVDLVTAEVRTGTQREAVMFSVGANVAHGLRRTNEDKRRAVKTLLADPEWSAWTDVAIAKSCGVSSNFVGDVRRIINPINDSPTRTVTRNGTTYEQNTASIGKSKISVEHPATDIALSVPATAAKKPTPAPADTPKDISAMAADASELAALRAENAALREELDDVKASFADTLADNAAMGRVIDADDQIKAAMDENKRLRAVADSAERIMHAKAAECAEAIRSAKYWMNRAEKSEKLNKASA